MNRLAVAVAASAMVFIGGCSGASNDGGDTTCKTFLAMRVNDRDATVAKMFKEREGRNASTGDIEAKRAVLVGLCQPADKQDSKISELA